MFPLCSKLEQSVREKVMKDIINLTKKIYGKFSSLFPIEKNYLLKLVKSFTKIFIFLLDLCGLSRNDIAI